MGELGNVQAANRAHVAAKADLERRWMQLQRNTDTELARLHGIFENEARGHQQAAHQSARLTQALQLVRGELAEQSRQTQFQEKIADDNQAVVDQLRHEASMREVSVQFVLDETLRRLQADHARQRRADD